VQSPASPLWSGHVMPGGMSIGMTAALPNHEIQLQRTRLADAPPGLFSPLPWATVIRRGWS
jgi:hypothetical protein